jgi:LPS-assembly protein
MYSPWVEFPLSNERKSGFLTPVLGSSGIRGFEYTQPYYLNLAPNYDATIVPSS